jgi:hypothetical protein
MFYGFLADVLGLIHLGYVSFVVIGQLLILIGIFRGWHWIRNMRFRVIHLIMILVVALESLGALMCPLTTWENQLRVRAGQTAVGDSYVANLLNNILFFNDLSYRHWIFQSGYVCFAAFVAMTFVIAPTCRPNRGPVALALNRRLLATALLATLGFIFLYTAWCMEDYKKSWDIRREENYQKALQEQAAQSVPPAKEDRLPVYFLAFSGVNFAGLALLCWALGPPGGWKEL